MRAVTTPPVPAVVLSLLLPLLGACAHTATAEAETESDGELAYGPCSQFEYIARGHAFANRLVCPDDTVAEKVSVGTSVLPDGRPVDTYYMSCPDTGRVEFDAPQDCSEPEVPAGLRLMPAEAAKAWAKGQQLYWKQEDLPGALPALEAAAAQAPDVADVQALLGFTLGRLDRHAEGVVHLDRALAAAPDRYWWRLWRGALLFRLERYDEAAEDFLWMVKLDPERVADSKAVQNLLGRSLHRAGREDEALPWRRRACELGHAPTCEELGLPVPAASEE